MSLLAKFNDQVDSEATMNIHYRLGSLFESSAFPIERTAIPPDSSAPSRITIPHRDSKYPDISGDQNREPHPLS